MHAQLGARPWLARTQALWATALHHRGLPTDRDQVADLIDRAGSTAAELGIADILHRTAALAQPPINTFRRDGDVWTLSFAGSDVQLKDAKGLRDIAALLSAAGREVPVTDLVNGAAVSAGLGADPVLDPIARERYRARLADLDEAIAQADEDGDPERSAAAGREREFLIHELSAAFGMGGRARRLGDDAERARKAMAARIRGSLDRIESRHPALGCHLRESITTGLYCRYAPADPASWRV